MWYKRTVILNFSNAQDKNFYLYILTNKYFKNTDRFFGKILLISGKMVNKYILLI